MLRALIVLACSGTMLRAEDVAIQIAIAKAKLQTGFSKGSPCIGNDLEMAKKKALAAGKPLLIWVGKCDQEMLSELPGCLAVHVKSYRGSDKERVIVTVPKDGSLYERVELLQPTAKEVLSVIK